MKRNLKIYEGNVDDGYNGNTTDATLLYDVGGDLLDFKYSQKSNYDIDTFYAKIKNRGQDIDTNDIWRCYDEGGVLIGSGYIEKEPILDKEGNLEISGYGWTGILTRRLVENTSYSATDGDNIFKDILTDYFSDYNINTAEVADSTGNITDTYDNRFAFDIMKEVSSMSYGANNRQFDFYIYESTAGTLKAKFFERGSGTAVAISSGDINFKDFNLVSRQDLNFNHVVVKGKVGDKVYTPSDHDWWTDDNASVADAWTDIGFTLAFDNYDKIGGESLEATADATGNDKGFTLNLDYTEAYSATYTANNFTSEVGYLNTKSRNQYLHFYILANRTMDCELRWYDETLTWTSSTHFQISGNDTFDDNAVWTEKIFNLSEVMGEDWIAVSILQFKFAKITAADVIYVDGLEFYDLKQFRGENPDSPTAPVRTYFYNDNELKTNAECDTLATTLYTHLSQAQYEGSLTLSAENTSIRAGSIIDIDYPQMNLSLDNIPVQEVEWGLNSQKLILGRHRSLSEIINEVKNEIRRKTG